MKFKQAISVFLVIMLVANLTLFVLKKISQLYFWLIIAVTGIIAFKVVPKIK